MDLKPCKCGRNVEIRYIAGMSRSLLKMVKDPFASTCPTWYIKCECGRNMCVRYRNRQTYEEQQKAKKYLIKAWNDDKEVDSVEVPEWEK